MQTLQQLRASTPKETKRFVKFLFVGAFGFVVDFGSFNLFHAIGLGPRAAHLMSVGQAYFIDHPEVIEQSCSFALAVISNFIWNYFWIYPEAQASNPGKKLLQFIVVSVAGLIIGAPVFALALAAARPLVAAAGLDTLSFNLAGNLALMTRVGVLLFWNFFVNRKWTYREVA
ncbi:MAG: GtrA family protein [Chloroflexi bacterium]|nr:GtrA family protein [Chloroflexota bacterium]